MRILLSGAHGFIGSTLAERLKTLGHTIIPLDRELLFQPTMLASFIITEHPDFIYHLAAYGNHSYQTDERQTFLTNVLGTYNMLETTKNYPYIGFVNVSTTSHNLEAGTFYGSTKSAGEYMARAFARVNKKPIVNVRPYSVYGEREWDFRFIPTIVNKIKRGQPITVSDVDHDWIYVQDFIDGLLAVQDKVAELAGKSIGLGTGHRISNMHIAKTLMLIAGKQVPIMIGEKREYEIANHEVMASGEKRNDELPWFEYGKTRLEAALQHIYEHPNFLTLNWVN